MLASWVRKVYCLLVLLRAGVEVCLELDELSLLLADAVFNQLVLDSR